MNKIIPIPAFHDNYIWMIVNAHGQTIVVDPGDAKPVLAALATNQYSLESILITHHHRDHTGGVDALVQQTQATVYAPGKPTGHHVDVTVNDNDAVLFKSHDLTFTVMATPGHTLDHVCYYTTGHLFCGDTLFAGGCGRLFEGTPEMMHRSLSRLARLPSNTRVYCAHEYTLANLRFALSIDPNNKDLIERVKKDQIKRDNQQPTIPSLLSDELATNPFLRPHAQALQVLAMHHKGQDKITNAEVFAIIRQLKDQS